MEQTLGAETEWSSYDAYLRSPEWKALRSLVLERDGYRCRFCNSRLLSLSPRVDENRQSTETP